MAEGIIEEFIKIIISKTFKKYKLLNYWNVLSGEAIDFVIDTFNIGGGARKVI